MPEVLEEFSDTKIQSIQGEKSPWVSLELNLAFTNDPA